MELEEFESIKVRDDLYKVNKDSYCGVYMPKKVMLKVLKLQHEYERKLLATLRENEDLLLTFDWTLNSEESRITQPQMVVNYLGPKEDTRRRVELFSKLTRPEKVSVVDIYDRALASEWIDFKLNLDSEILEENEH